MASPEKFQKIYFLIVYKAILKKRLRKSLDKAAVENKANPIYILILLSAKDWLSTVRPFQSGPLCFVIKCRFRGVSGSSKSEKCVMHPPYSNTKCQVSGWTTTKTKLYFLYNSTRCRTPKTSVLRMNALITRVIVAMLYYLYL